MVRKGVVLAVLSPPPRGAVKRLTLDQLEQLLGAESTITQELRAAGLGGTVWLFAEGGTE